MTFRSQAGILTKNIITIVVTHKAMERLMIVIILMDKKRNDRIRQTKVIDVKSIITKDGALRESPITNGIAGSMEETIRRVIVLQWSCQDR